MTSSSPGAAYIPPTQSRLGQWIDAIVLLLFVFGALYAPVLLGWTSPAARGEEAADPTWVTLHQSPAMVAQWEKLGYTAKTAAPLISSRFDYTVDPWGLTATALVLFAYFAMLLIYSDRQYKDVIRERFGDSAE
jgi:hypothetical protein